MVQLLVSLVLCFATSNLIAADVKVGGVTFKDSTDFNSSTVVRLGAGVRKKFFVSVYALAAYSESGSCDVSSIISEQESKYMKLVILLPEVSGSTISNALKDSIYKNFPENPSPELLASVDNFLSVFNFPLKKVPKWSSSTIRSLAFCDR